MWLSTENIKVVGATELKKSVKFAPKFIGPFPVEEVVNANAYRLKMPKDMEIHPVVNISRLKPFVNGEGQFPDREVEDVRPKEVFVDANGEGEFEVEKILATRGRRGQRQYLVKWTGYPAWESSWEKEGNLANAQQNLKQFEEAIKQQQTEQREQLMGIFKGIESVTEQHGDKEIEEMRKRLLAL